MTVWRFATDKPRTQRMSLGRRVVYHVGMWIAARQKRDLALRTRASGGKQTVGALMAAARASPCASLKALTGGGPIIVLAPHPDDETLGCGGLLAACAAAGIPAYVFVLTDGTLSHPGDAISSQGLRRLRFRETVKALRAIGLGSGALRSAGLRDGRALLDSHGMRRAARKLARFAIAINAKRLFVSWRHDPHPDHMAAALVAERARADAPRLRIMHYPIRGRFLPPETQLGSTWSATRLDIRRQLPRKRRAMAAYRSQTTPLVRGMVAFRFHQNEANVFMAPTETFFEEIL